MPEGESSAGDMCADVVIVGTGPAGGMAAWMAAEKGARVIVVDRKKTIGEPVLCGEGTFLEVLARHSLDKGPWIVDDLTTMGVKVPGMKDKYYTPKKFKGVILDRALFEQEICRRAEAAGAKILLGKVVVGLEGSSLILHDGSRVSGKTIIGADGVGSQVGRWAGITKTVPVKDLVHSAQYLVEGRGWKAKEAVIHLDKNGLPGGYAWVFPKSDTMANIGVILDASSGLNPRKVLDDLLSKNYPGVKRLQSKGGCAPVGPPLDSAVKGNIALAGDAAHFTTPFGVGGIHSALFSGAILGQVAARAALANDPEILKEYDVIWKKGLHKALTTSYKIRTRFYTSEKYFKRYLRMFKLGGAFVTHIPFNPLKLWWGRMDDHA